MNNQTENINNCDFTSDLQLKGFKVYQINGDQSKIPVYSRRDFYKICINTSKSIIQYADRGIETDGTILFFGNPIIPYSWETISGEYEGYACVFTEEFLKSKERSEALHESPLFKIGGTPIFSLTADQKGFIDSLFQKMIQEYETDYAFKDDLMRNYINLILHESMKMQPSENFFKPKNASSRITSLFLELLERQFPIETKDQPLLLKTPQDYAQSLAVHVNHLNRSVKEVTGKPTTSHITERVINEAKALLQHTDWSISDIGYSLGFEYPSYFNNYFKRLTGTVPKSLRM
ncbi:transcriptional regulator, AraC family [Flavobacterium resistens]|uniref:Helix-turn-helix domain-containing protein n=1 Tax=Flavobacterium resistens TaxID=443612 RepID=A0A521AXP0_9FLAO|nr:helix-turn-helix transcriptional regulator [Flavobacterium resistens]MRX68466.1 helix-turn-helix domain-containing protein [Flavobacterium resistens]SMO39584.1 transcriptional regulator, AraC family [Flavobacterium resistens]